MWVMIYRETDDGELEIEVECSVTPGEPKWFNAAEGIGHPGSDPEVEILSATVVGTDEDVTEALTPAEISAAEELALEAYADGEDSGW